LTRPRRAPRCPPARRVAHLELQSAECERLMPGGLEGAQAAAATLLRALGAADAELGAANARSVMYSRLEERTRCVGTTSMVVPIFGGTAVSRRYPQ
jgi:hypothetical protein